jgi:hypothetical protein
VRRCPSSARWIGAACTGAIAACNVSSGPATSGGVSLDGGANEGQDGGACPTFLGVVDSDFMTSNVSVLSSTGEALSPSIISSGSTSPGVSAALSGDVVLPLATTPGTIVLIDRTNAVLTWVDPATARVVHQLSVGTGFASNPHDYVAMSPTRAYVTRYENNPTPGRQPYDVGGDVLVVDPSAATITGNVPFAMDGAFLPRPDRMMRVGDQVWVSLLRFDVSGYMTEGDARFVGVSTVDDSIAWTLDLPGVANCSGLALSPSGTVVAVSCSGAFSDVDPIQRSAIVLLDATRVPPVEIERIPAAAQLGAQLGFTLAYARGGLLFGTAFGGTPSRANDIAYTVDVGSAMATVLFDAGAPFELGDVRCSPGCTNLCFLTDAKAKVLQVWNAGATLVMQPPVAVDPAVGLPPQALGAF